jgi:hypothetical protein
VITPKGDEALIVNPTSDLLDGSRCVPALYSRNSTSSLRSYFGLLAVQGDNPTILDDHRQMPPATL